MDVDPSKVAASYPGKKSLSSMLDEEEIYALAIIRRRLAGKKKFFSCDGANEGIFYVENSFSGAMLIELRTF